MNKLSQLNLQKVLRTHEVIFDFSVQNKSFEMHNVALATLSCTFCRPHLPKVFRACQLRFQDFEARGVATVGLTEWNNLMKLIRDCCWDNMFWYMGVCVCVVDSTMTWIYICLVYTHNNQSMICHVCSIHHVFETTQVDPLLEIVLLSNMRDISLYI